QRDKLEDMLRQITPERVCIGDTMVYCLDHAESAEEIVDCIAESLSILQTPVPKKIGRLFLVSDILYNSSAKVPNASFFRKFFETKLPEVFGDMRETYQCIEGRLKAEQFKQKVMACFRAWEDWTIYPQEFLIRLQNIFLGLITANIMERDILEDPVKDDIPQIPVQMVKKKENYDGVPVSEDLDGVPTVEEETVPSNIDIEPIDGVPLKEDLDGIPIDLNQDIDGIPLYDLICGWKVIIAYDSICGWKITNGDCAMHGLFCLIFPQLKVLKFQDELEAGKRNRKRSMTITEQVAHYRAKLLQKEKEKEREKERDRIREWEKRRVKEFASSPPSEGSPYGKKRRRSSSRSPSPHGKYKSRSSSPSSDRYGSSRRSSQSPSSSYREQSPQSQSPLLISSSSRRRKRKSRSRSPGRKSHRFKTSHKSRSRSRSPRRSRRSRSHSHSPRRHRRSRSRSPRKSSSHKKKRQK
ncbi:U2 snRNP-associated SURP motif-containing protein-like, partial [Saccoglossus kowalevskii]